MKPLAIGIALCFCLACTAKADFTVNVVTTHVTTGIFAGDLQLQYFAHNNGQDGTIGIEVVDLTFSDSGGAHMIMRTQDNGDGTSSIDFGGHIAPNASFIRVGTIPTDFSIIYTVPQQTSTNAAYPDLMQLQSFRAAGNYLPPGQYLLANTGLGVSIGQVVVPNSGDTIVLSGGMSDELGKPFYGQVSDRAGIDSGVSASFSLRSLPEPGNLIVPTSLLMLIGYRRRAQQTRGT